MKHLVAPRTPDEYRRHLERDHGLNDDESADIFWELDDDTSGWDALHADVHVDDGGEDPVRHTHGPGGEAL